MMNNPVKFIKLHLIIKVRSCRYNNHQDQDKIKIKLLQRDKIVEKKVEK